MQSVFVEPLTCARTLLVFKLGNSQISIFKDLSFQLRGQKIKHLSGVSMFCEDKESWWVLAYGYITDHPKLSGIKHSL